MDYDRSLNKLRTLEHIFERRYIVSFNGAEICKSHCLKQNVVGQQEVFYSVLQPFKLSRKRPAALRSLKRF